MYENFEGAIKEYEVLFFLTCLVLISTTTTTTTNFIENWKVTNYITFPPANSL